MTERIVDATALFDRAEANGISLEWLAVMTGVSFATVYAYKMGRRRVQQPWYDRAALVIAARDDTPPLRNGVSR